MTFTDLLLFPITLTVFLIDILTGVVSFVLGALTVLFASVGCVGVIVVLAFCIIICSAGFF